MVKAIEDMSLEILYINKIASNAQDLLEISFNSLSLSEVELERLLLALRKNTNLKKLDLINCNLPDNIQLLNSLKTLIQEHPSIEEFLYDSYELYENIFCGVKNGKSRKTL